MTSVWANHFIFDRVITAADGQHVGMVDDIELSDPWDDAAQPAVERAPELTALLSGPTALGPRLGGRIGTWWLALGRRLRPTGRGYPNRIPVEAVKTFDIRGVELKIDTSEVATRRLDDWILEHIVLRIPGNGS